MAAPSKSFTVIPDGDIDPDSPLTTSLFVSLQGNDENLFAQLVGDPVGTPPFTPAAAHDHNGVNSKRAESGLVFLERHESSGDESDFDFSATLDGDTEAQTITLRANAVDEAVVIGSSAGTLDFIFGMVFAKRTVESTTKNPGYVGVHASDGAVVAVLGDDFAVGANITSLGVDGDIRQGSAFSLYRMVQA